MPVCGRGDVEEDGEGRSRLVSGVEQGYVGDVAAQGDLPVVQIAEGGLVLQFEGQSVGYLLEWIHLGLNDLRNLKSNGKFVLLYYTLSAIEDKSGIRNPVSIINRNNC